MYNCLKIVKTRVYTFIKLKKKFFEHWIHLVYPFFNWMIFLLIADILFNIVLYSHDQLYKHICMRNHNNDTIKTMTQFFKKMYLTLFESGVCERELETKQNCNTLTPTLLDITAFLYRSPGLLNQGPGAQPLWQLVFSTVSYLQLVWSPKIQSGVPRAPSAGCCFLYSIIFQNSDLQTVWFSYALLYNSSPPTQSPPITGHRNMHFRRLWNGMFERHRAEITVMQFTGHSLPMHQFVTIPRRCPWCFRRCPWYNGYRRRKWTRRHEFKSWTKLIAFHIALIPLGKVWIKLFSLQLWVNSRTALLRQLVYEKENSEFKPVKLRLKINLIICIPWDFSPVPYCQPSSPMPMEYALPPSLEWHVRPGRRSIYHNWLQEFQIIF